MANPAPKQSYEHGGSLTLIKNLELRVAGQDTAPFASEQDVFVPDLVSRQAQDAPDAPAIVVGSDVLTYRDLNSRSNQLAHYLRTMGVGPEVLVGVWLERSADFVVAAPG